MKEKKLENENASIEEAERCIKNFEYEKGMDICLKLVEQDYNNEQAHVLILETFNSLGFKNKLALKTRDRLKAIVLNQKFN